MPHFRAVTARGPGARPRHARRRRPHRGRDDRARVPPARRDVRPPPRGPVDRRRRRSPAATRSASATRCRATTRCSAGTCWAACSTSWAATSATAPRTSRCSRSARATPGPATSRASGGGSGSRSSARPMRPPGTALPRPYDLDDAKGVLELLATRLGLGRRDLRRPSADEPLFHPGRTARARCRGTGCRPSSASSTRTSSRPGSCARPTASSWPRSRSRGSPRAAWRRNGRPAVGRFPEVDRDLAIVVPEATPRPPSRRVIRAHAGELLQGVALFDIYRGVPLAATRRASPTGCGSAPRTGRSPSPRSRRRWPRSWRRCPPSGAASAPDAGR